MSKTGTEVLNSATQCERVELGRFHRPADLDGAGAVPGLVLIHDVFGPSEHSQELAGALAGEGFGILSYDEGFLAGPEGRSLEKKPTSPIEAGELYGLRSRPLSGRGACLP